MFSTSVHDQALEWFSYGFMVPIIINFHRDRSAAVTLKRVLRPGGKDGELIDEWLEFYHKQENEEEFPLRNNQVKSS